MLIGTKSGDNFNERPTREGQSIAASAPTAPSCAAALATSATIHTMLGDMHIRLGYYDNVILRRIIPKFMIQTGDPLVDGTGGTSIWDHDFEDEFSDNLKHESARSGRVFLLSLDVATSSITSIDVTKKLMEFMFKENGSRNASNIKVRHTLHNTLLY
ncbi:hypothetical protein EDB89DRAFT_2234214 [Lactarius sanguifluus]|nr:hypothetical protein EDB89DRAFT_2234214 [Lactarius sanguifluus]